MNKPVRTRSVSKKTQSILAFKNLNILAKAIFTFFKHAIVKSWLKSLNEPLYIDFGDRNPTD
jgi:hypothetical protein